MTAVATHPNFARAEELGHEIRRCRTDEERGRTVRALLNNWYTGLGHPEKAKAEVIPIARPAVPVEPLSAPRQAHAVAHFTSAAERSCPREPGEDG